MKHIASIIFSLLIATLTATGGLHDIRFLKIGIDKGLSHATVNGISQDSLGYIWVATPEGLNRYDGYEFTTFTPDTANHKVTAVSHDRNGGMWTINERTLAHYIPETEKFELFHIAKEFRLRSLEPLADGRIAVGSSLGLLYFLPDKKLYVKEKLSRQKPVTAIASSGTDIAAGYEDGAVEIYHKNKKTAVMIPGNAEINSLMYEKGYFYIGTEGNGLWQFNLRSRKLSRIGEGHGIDFVRCMLRDRLGRLWVGTFTGLYIYDADIKDIIHSDNTSIPQDALSHSSVRRMYADRQGGIWLGTYFGGLNYYHPQLLQFTTLRKTGNDLYSLNDNIAGPLAEDNFGNIWIGTNNGGVNIYNPASGEFRKITCSGGLGSNDVKAIYIDERQQTAYIGTHIGGITEVSLDTYRAKGDRDTSASVYDILPAGSGSKLWLATLDGVCLYDKNGGFSHAITSEGIPTVTTNLMRDSKGRIWISGQGGVAVFSEKDDNLKLLPEMPRLSMHISHVYQSHGKPVFWISSHRGLYRYDESTRKITRFCMKDGLPGNIVYATMEDPVGNIWGSTNRGLFQLNPSTGEIITYNNRNGLDNTQFSENSSLYAHNGMMYFGGLNGVTIFNPSVMDINQTVSAPMIDRLLLYNVRVTPGDNTGLLEKSLSQTGHLTFKADQTNFTLGFTSCDYLSHGDNTFQYMLEGIDTRWTAAPDGVRWVTYSNLPAGDYTFRLKMANNDGVWSDKEATIGITILPPWYLRPWVLALFAAAALAGGYFALRTVWKRKKLEKQRLAQQEIYEMKVRFFVNMSHELRTPLTLMLLPVDELIASHPDPATLQKLTTIRNNTLRIQHRVNQLLDYRRAELGMFRLNVSEVNINSLMATLLEPYESLAAKKNIKFCFNSTAPDEGVMLDSDYVELIVNNLVTNAFKYTPKGGTITIDVSTEDYGRLTIRVSDSGCGIPSDRLDHIFTRFYQLNDTAGGYGIGLSLVKRLTELHHGSISVESEPGRGTAFSVTLPTDPNAYTPLETGDDNRKSVSHDEDVGVLLPIDEDSSGYSLPADDSRKKVLVADDNAEILKYLSAYLSKDFNVLTAANGTKAIELLGSDTIDLVISDVMMPDIDGVQLCRTIKRNLRTSHIPVILLSAKADLSDRLDGLKVGADDYIAKPFQMEELIAKVRNQIRTRENIIKHYSQDSEINPHEIAGNPLDEDFLKKAMKTIIAHLDDTEFTTEKFAREMCMSRSNLHLKMKALTGEATNDFIRRTRMKKAAELLKTRQYTVAEVSAMTGYSTPSYFATAFKNFFGYPPSRLLSES